MKKKFGENYQIFKGKFFIPEEIFEVIDSEIIPFKNENVVYLKLIEQVYLIFSEERDFQINKDIFFNLRINDSITEGTNLEYNKIVLDPPSVNTKLIKNINAVSLCYLKNKIEIEYNVIGMASHPIKYKGELIVPNKFTKIVSFP